MSVDPYRRDDEAWLRAVWGECKHILGTGVDLMLHRYGQRISDREKIIVIRPFAFAHYRERLDGVRNLYEIGVSAVARRQGHGRRLIEAIGRPLILKTDLDNEASNAFYVALGFKFMGWSWSRNLHKQFNNYLLDVSLV